MRLIDFFKKDKWKEKAKRYSKEKNALKKRIKELKLSRDIHKKKYNDLKEKYDDLEAEKKNIEPELKKN